MEKIKQNGMKILLAGFVLLLTLGLFPMDSHAAPKLNKSKATVYVGKTVKLKVKGTKKKVKWSSTNKKICTVSKKGVVTGKKKGTAYIKAKVAKKTLKCKITVKKKGTVTPKSISLSADSNVLAPGGSLKLNVKYKPSNAKKLAVNWYTSDSWKATVKDGLVTAAKTGTVTITAKLASNEAIYATYDITIKDVTATIDALHSGDGGDLLLTDPNAKQVVQFTLSDTLAGVKVNVLDSLNNVVYTFDKGKVGASVPVTCEWNLSAANGGRVSAGSYCFEIVAAGASIKSDYFKVYASSEFGSGNGSPTSPYPISSAEQLQLVANHNGACFIQTADIDYGLTELTPLFSEDVPFVGTYDGGNHVIRNASTIIDGEETSIFRAIGDKGCVQNVSVEDSFFNGKHNVSALVGINHGTISNCKIVNCSVTASDGDAAILVSWNYGTIKNCSVTECLANGKDEWGDLAAICAYNKGIVSNCIVTNSNVAGPVDWLGGIAGKNDGSIVECQVIASVIKGNSHASIQSRSGGIVGINYGTVANCTVKETEIYGFDAGGVIGWNYGNNVNNAYDGELNQVD